MGEEDYCTSVGGQKAGLWGEEGQKVTKERRSATGEENKHKHSFLVRREVVGAVVCCTSISVKLIFVGISRYHHCPCWRFSSLNRAMPFIPARNLGRQLRTFQIVWSTTKLTSSYCQHNAVCWLLTMLFVGLPWSRKTTARVMEVTTRSGVTLNWLMGQCSVQVRRDWLHK